MFFHTIYLLYFFVENVEYNIPQFLAQGVEDPDSLMVYYVMLRGIDRFCSDYNHQPGEFGDEHDIVKLKVVS